MRALSENPWRQLALPTVVVVLVAALLSQLPTVQDKADPQAPPDGQRLVNGLGMTLLLIPAGEFTMGNTAVGAAKSELPLREVTVRPFYMSQYEVTQAQWVAVMGKNPSLYRGASHPVDQVTWIEVQSFIQKLNQLEKTDKYRLPSEAEWEYAARAGETGDYGFGSDAALLPQYGWYGQRGNIGTRPVGQQRKANAWGLYDMHGNVWEWVEDCWHANYEGAPRDGRAWVEEGGCNERVLRGGGWSSAAPYLRSSVRGSYAYDLNDVSNGFRLAKTP